MENYFKKLENLGIKLPSYIEDILKNCINFRSFNTTDEIVKNIRENSNGDNFKVNYKLPNGKIYTEAIVHSVKNGISANYTESYMRRRDPETMVIADNNPTDKTKFQNRYNFKFSDLQNETFQWLKDQNLSTFFYFAGRENIGSYGIVIAPSNAAFFSMSLSMLQKIVSIDQLPKDLEIKSVIFVAPTFRHTHFNGKQVVVHNRTEKIHELYSFNLYPGPSAKKGLYGVLLNQGEREGWTTTHCSVVQSISPYDNVTTFMHEGASGGGKSEMLQHIVRERDGRVLLGKNSITGKTRYITIPRFCLFDPVADDMALCPPSIQKNNGKLSIIDAETSWFIRVDSIKKYGDDPHLENITIHSKTPLLFLNIDTKPNSTALIWEHIKDTPKKSCPNPRVIVPRKDIDNIVNKPVSIDIRSFGLRTPKCSIENPTYGIVGLFHILPPSIAWLWRLVAPRGFNNPSIVGGDKMESEGVGSYWPFATGRRVTQANLLLKQIINSPKTTFTLVPNQNIGVWEVNFRPQLLMREYLTRRGVAKLNSDQYQEARSPLLGYELNYLTIESSKIPSRFLKVYNQPEVGLEGYDRGAKILQNFFNQELVKYLDNDLLPEGRRIIELCLSESNVEEYNKIIPMGSSYSFNGVGYY